MTRKILKTLIAIFSALLAAELLFLGFLSYAHRDEAEDLMSTPTTQAAPVRTEASSAPEITEATAAPTETTVPPTTQPAETRYTLTFVGDCTLGSDPSKYGSVHSFVGTVGENYAYPFANVLEYFENDDLTLINLEGVFADSGYAQDKTFTFRGPTAYTEILTGSSVEAVSLANNHSFDYGQAGYDSTKQSLEDAGVAYVEENKTQLITTESGLTVGIYADAFQFSTGEIATHIGNLKKAGAEIIICAFHWGTEGSYRATAAQEQYAHAAIDAGAHIVWGHHPHVLQKLENYNGGLILYSLGNFSFGGNHFPRDYDSAVIQQEIIRAADGSISLGGVTIIPVSISSVEGQNNFQPTPYEVNSEEYQRVIDKLRGTFTGPDLVVNYEKETTPETQTPTEVPETQAPTVTPETQVPETQAPTAPATQPEEPTAAPTQPAQTDPAPTQPPAEEPAQPENGETTG